MRIAAAIVVCAGVGALVPSTSLALFHISVIDEVVSSWDGDESQQFVEIQLRFDAQRLVSNTVLAVFDQDGAYIEDLLIVPEDIANGANLAHWTMATEEFQQANGFDADFTMSAGIPQGGGMVCWGAPSGTLLPPADPASWDHTDPTNYVDCLAYGTYAGPSNPLIGTPTTLVPEGHSLARVSETDDNASDFACADVAMPTNNAGESVSLDATTPCGTSRGSGIQVTPDGKRVLINKDVDDERWAITRNLDDLTVTGNVFFPEGGDPLFLFCEQTGEDGDNLDFSCSGADQCTDTCPPFEFVSNVTLPKSFFQPPVDVAAVASRIEEAVVTAGVGATRSAAGGRGASACIQITPDELRVLITGDVANELGDHRNPRRLTVTGNVLPRRGRPPSCPRADRRDREDVSFVVRHRRSPTRAWLRFNVNVTLPVVLPATTRAGPMNPDGRRAGVWQPTT
jgi:hypothetical protein